MLLSTNTYVQENRFGIDKAIEMTMDAGFDAIDYSFFNCKDPSYHLLKEGYRETCERLRRMADDRHVIFNQGHAPFGGGYQNYIERLVPLFPRIFECAAILGIKTMVVHPIQDGRFYGHEDEMLDRSIAFYRSLLPLAKEYNVKIGVENMWQTDVRGYIVDDTLASPAQFCACIDRLDSEYIVACLDLGHVGLCGRDASDLIRALGHERLHALHVHDNDNIHDSHTLPYLGKMNWEDILAALRDIRYDGEFTYEAENFLVKMDNDFFPTALRFMHDMGRHLIQKIGL